jgi:hypothetical protein
MKAKKMARYRYLRIVFGVLLLLLIYFVVNKDFVIREYLTDGPPTLLTLQNDTKELDTKLTDLKTDFDNMKEQAKQGADAAATARAQINLVKNSTSTTSPP